MSRVSKFAWGVLVYVQLVIVFGAFVRATGSGAGCGSHWPLCNGEVIPRAARIETVIEFTHRFTSGLTLLLVLMLALWVWRLKPPNHPVRWSSALALFFTLSEALIGAWLVLYGLVASNDSVTRAVSMAVHLVNTFFLLASLALTAWWASSGNPRRFAVRRAEGWFLSLACLATLVLGVSGAVTALGDTLFPPSSLISGLQQDLSPTHYLVRLRVFHPFIALFAGLLLTTIALWLKSLHPRPEVRFFGNGLVYLFSCQILLGAVNVTLLAPVWMQLAHLFMTTLIWITLVLLAASVVETKGARVTAG